VDPIVIPRPVEDGSSQEKTLSERQWEAIRDQRNQLIKFMTTIFGWLNGAMILIVLIGMAADQWNISHHADTFKVADRFIGSTVVTSLIAATVAQAGLAFIAITKFLFPSSADTPR
jgi:hypothetical protein